jgi:hypothetical protein
MIDFTEIQELVDKDPFQSFRIRMSDGNHYDVTNPDLVVPMESMLFIALPKSRWKFLSYQNMTSIESSEVDA